MNLWIFSTDDAITSETLILTLLLSFFVLKNFRRTPLMVMQGFVLAGIPVEIKSYETLLRLTPGGFHSNFFILKLQPGMYSRN